MSTENPGPRTSPGVDIGARSADPSVSELAKQLTEQAQTLARKEVELAKVEVMAKGKRLGLGAGAFGAAGVVGLYALGALTAALVLVLATAIAAWVAALIVAVVYAAIAAVLGVTGKKQVDQGTPPMPEQALASTKRDVAVAKQRVREGRS